MVKQILVCLEGSPSGHAAVEVALGLARALPATLSGLAIVDEPDIRAGEPTPIGGASFKAQRDEALLADAHLQARAWLDAFAARCRSAGVPARPIETEGRPAAAILAETRHHDLVVLGRHANFRFETEDRDWHTRDAVLRGAKKPVVLVPESPREAGPAVLVAYDGTAASVRAIRSFAESGLPRARPLHVLSVGDDGSTAWELAERGCALFRELGLDATAHHVVSLKPIAEAILDEAARLDAGLIVQGAYAHSRFARLLWGSVTRDMLEKTTVPLFLHY